MILISEYSRGEDLPIKERFITINSTYQLNFVNHLSNKASNSLVLKSSITRDMLVSIGCDIQQMREIQQNI